MQVNPQLYESLSIINDKSSIDSIPQDSDSVNTKFSYQDQSIENVKKAEKHFGTTYNINEAGYLLTDGKFLDFNGKHDGAPGGYRTVDHRYIRETLGLEYGGDDYSGGMKQIFSIDFHFFLCYNI